MSAIKKFYLQTQEGVLTDDDFVGDALPIGDSDKRYSKIDLEDFAKLAVQLKANTDKSKK